MPSPTHRVYSIRRWSSSSAVVGFYEGHYESQTDPDGTPRNQFVRTRVVGDRVYTLDGTFTEEDLRELLDDELEQHGSLPSVAPQARRRAPRKRPRAVNVRRHE